MFWSLLNRFQYSEFTPGNLARGSERIDDLRKEIRCTAHLLVSKIGVDSFLSHLYIFTVKKYFLAGTDALCWVLHCEDRKLVLRCTNRRGVLFFSTDDSKKDIPVEHVVAAHRCLKVAARKVPATFGGVALGLKPFLEAAAYKG